MPSGAVTVVVVTVVVTVVVVVVGADVDVVVGASVVVVVTLETVVVVVGLSVVVVPVVVVVLGVLIIIAPLTSFTEAVTSLPFVSLMKALAHSTGYLPGSMSAGTSYVSLRTTDLSAASTPAPLLSLNANSFVLALFTIAAL